MWHLWKEQKQKSTISASICCRGHKERWKRGNTVISSLKWDILRLPSTQSCKRLSTNYSKDRIRCISKWATRWLISPTSRTTTCAPRVCPMVWWLQCSGTRKISSTAFGDGQRNICSIKANNARDISVGAAKPTESLMPRERHPTANSISSHP